MPVNKTDDAYEITWLIRRLFRAMAQKSGESLDGVGVSVADRAVMEFLHPDQALSVPDVAKRYKVSRQHVQVTVNSLLDKKLLVTRDNPRHKRSPLISLSPKGRKLFESIKAGDESIVRDIFAGVSVSDKRATLKTLTHLLQQLA